METPTQNFPTETEKHTNIPLRVVLGLALLSYLLPFATLRVFLVGTESVSGLSLLFEESNVTVIFFVLLITFVLSFCKQPLGKWIVGLPLLAVLILFRVVSNSTSGSGVFEVSLGAGIYCCLFASLAATILGFKGGTGKLSKLVTILNNPSSKGKPLSVEDPAVVAKLLTRFKWLVFSIAALLLAFILSEVGGIITLFSWVVATVFAVVAFLRLAAVLQYEIPTRIAISLCILFPLINVITLAVLAVRIGSLLKSNGVQINLFSDIGTKIQKFLISPVTKFVGK